MKIITKERTKVEKYTIYEAVDGTQFDSKEECEQYDNSAKGVLRGKLKGLVVNEQYDCINRLNKLDKVNDTERENN